MPKKSRRHRATSQGGHLARPQTRAKVVTGESPGGTATVPVPEENTNSPAAAISRPPEKPRYPAAVRSSTPPSARGVPDYRYVGREFRRIVFLAASLFAILTVLAFILR